ncbi:MAG TPA: hypothetical protein VIC51_15415 [Psychromonas sp.]
MELSIFQIIITVIVVFLSGMVAGWILSLDDDTEDNDLHIV